MVNSRRRPSARSARRAPRAGVTAFLIGGMLGTFIGWRPVFGIIDRRRGDRVLSELQADAGSGPAGGQDRPRRRGARRRLHHPHQPRLQQPEPLGARRGAPRSAVRPLRLLAGAGHDRRRHRAAPGLHHLDPAAAGSRQDPAARPAGHHLQSGAGGGDLHVLGRLARGDAELLRASLYPDRPGPHADRNGDRDAALQPDRILHGDAGGQVVQDAHAAPDRPARLRALHGGAALARLRGAQRLERRLRSCSG